ncbi:MAG: hypothetical protein JZU62_09250 [Sulfuricurvum sp.]|uniref:hypothetical protein n=1 Tax=Sulfuricurvum sp. TaxID=2025608 RepID=UPI0025E89A47|nr:hypothetical protein [Sulfuricurvum sp.]MBV5321862.1 hypothetical protein [Sulfuricurvum sp.]
MWLTKLKTALVLENIEQLSSLLDEMPQFESIEQIEEVSYLLIQTKSLIEKNKAETAQILIQLKNNLNFLKSTQEEPPSSLNLKF